MQDASLRSIVVIDTVKVSLLGHSLMERAIEHERHRRFGHNLHKKGMSHEEILAYLNKKCGVAGISGVSSDFRDLISGAKKARVSCRDI